MNRKGPVRCFQGFCCLQAVSQERDLFTEGTQQSSCKSPSALRRRLPGLKKHHLPPPRAPSAQCERTRNICGFCRSRRLFPPSKPRPRAGSVPPHRKRRFHEYDADVFWPFDANSHMPRWRRPTRAWYCGLLRFFARLSTHKNSRSL